MCDPDVENCIINTYGHDCFYEPSDQTSDTDDDTEGSSDDDVLQPTGQPGTRTDYLTGTGTTETLAWNRRNVARNRRNVENKPTASLQVGPILIGSRRK